MHNATGPSCMLHDGAGGAAEKAKRREGRDRGIPVALILGMAGLLLLAAIAAGYAYEVLLLARAGRGRPASVEPPPLAHAPERGGVDAQPGGSLLQSGRVGEHRAHVAPFQLLERDVTAHGS